jgi:hypothetical protein
VDVIPAQSAPADVVGTSVVFLGSFDPLVFQPVYMAEHGLLTDSDLTQLRYQFLANELMVLNLPWMQLSAEPGKIIASTTAESPIVEPVRDFLFALYETLPVRKVSAVGINHETHFAVQSEEAWHKLGHTLVPKEPLWNGVLVSPGTATVTIRGQRDDDFQGHINVRVEPSTRLHPGIYVNVNDDMRLAAADSDRLVNLAAAHMEASKARSDRIVSALKGME